MLERSQIETAIKNYQDPYLKLDLVAAGAVRNIVINNDQVTVDIVLGYPANGYKEQLIIALKKILLMVTGITAVEINVSWKIAAHVTQNNVPAIPQVKNIIAVASGKGGVGKSTTAVNLALALHLEGAKVGILDADIYGPNQPQMLGAYQRAEVKENKRLLPVKNHGLQSMSMGYLVDKNAPMIWRGPMVTTALLQLLRDTDWDDLDYLLIDLPPGTGDIQLTLAQKIPVAGGIIVTTPQEIALLDARKGLEMFRKVNIPVLGIIENMSMHICSQCGHEEAIFGVGGGEQLAQTCAVELLGKLPLDKSIREHADGGHPTVIINPEGTIAALYRDIARKLAAKLSLQPKNYSSRFPKIVIE